MLVSSAMAVVITRVTPSMLPPTTITAPTSEAARPKPAITTVSSEKRVSHSTRGHGAQRRDAQRGELLAVLVPRVLGRLAGERRDDGHHEHRLRHHDRRGREEDAQRPEGPGAREQQVDHEAHHDARQAEQRVEDDDERAPAGKAPHGDERAQGQPDRGAGDGGGERELQREDDDPRELRVGPADEPEGHAKACKNFKHCAILPNS